MGAAAAPLLAPADYACTRCASILGVVAGVVLAVSLLAGLSSDSLPVLPMSGRSVVAAFAADGQYASARRVYRSRGRAAGAGGDGGRLLTGAGSSCGCAQWNADCGFQPRNLLTARC